MSHQEDIFKTFRHTYGEKRFRQFIVQNLHRVEPGLAPYPDLARCQEFPCPYGEQGRAGVIDVLGIDVAGALVTMECKLYAGPTAIGQVAGYMAWATRALAKPGQEVRGLIVALEVSALLVLALRYLKPTPIEVIKVSPERMVRVT